MGMFDRRLSSEVEAMILKDGDKIEIIPSSGGRPVYGVVRYIKIRHNNATIVSFEVFTKDGEKPTRGLRDTET